MSVLQQLADLEHHRRPLDEVKRQLNIHHDEFDCWIYGFLENFFKLQLLWLQKLRRRDTMERNELACFEITDYMRDNMAKGIIQHIGDDKEGRPTFYIVTKRDSPTAKRREENMRNFDMWVSYGSKLRSHDKRCRLTMLINQKDASMWSNTDMTFQADVAMRIAKYYPGVVEKLYLCKMSNTLATLAKPIFSRLPAIVSDRIQIFTDSDLKKGKLLELFDEHILPTDLGGRNDCDQPSHWAAYARSCVQHFEALQEAVGTRGYGVKEWELDVLQQADMRNRENEITSPRLVQFELTNSHDRAAVEKMNFSGVFENNKSLRASSSSMHNRAEAAHLASSNHTLTTPLKVMHRRTESKSQEQHRENDFPAFAGSIVKENSQTYRLQSISHARRASEVYEAYQQHVQQHVTHSNYDGGFDDGARDLESCESDEDYRLRCAAVANTDNDANITLASDDTNQRKPKRRSSSFSSETRRLLQQHLVIEYVDEGVERHLASGDPFRSGIAGPSIIETPPSTSVFNNGVTVPKGLTSGEKISGTSPQHHDEHRQGTKHCHQQPHHLQKSSWWSSTRVKAISVFLSSFLRLLAERMRFRIGKHGLLTNLVQLFKQTCILLHRLRILESRTRALRCDIHCYLPLIKSPLCDVPVAVDRLTS
ncbi:Hypothetical protein, putative [Bodo saltans]|uniref:CRAL-TRIO domain-containing protein n=1 Tax=Bodo saltans TaxID=75058 RepID=A0A0S4ITC7_BODSA|nr:Hypothetical protein, putative [Bodo saltans]|eukprot:CUF79933.1 Hypothetical protein, putative [Bodo saltans]